MRIIFFLLDALILLVIVLIAASIWSSGFRTGVKEVEKGLKDKQPKKKAKK